MTDGGQIHPSGPWPWLEPFDENASSAFGGRDEDVQALLRGILATPACVLFGRSGLGKTSLLLAGLFHVLRNRMLLPVAIRRIEYGSGAADISTQLHRALGAAIASAQLRWSRQPGGNETTGSMVADLWTLLHGRERQLLDADGRRWTPVFVLDQFEEIFTLETDAARRRQAFHELGDLLENRVPPEIAARIETDDALLDRVDFDAQPYRFLVALREDFLPDLEQWTGLIPRLGPNRYRLLPLSDRTALESVRKTGGALVDESSAQSIVQFLNRQSAGVRVRDDRRVEPALLSLVCASLNADRLARTPPGVRLDVSDLETRGVQILDRFYDDAFAAVDETVRASVEAWVEQNLITASGSRRPYPVGDLDVQLRTSLKVLEKRRLLRTEVSDQRGQIELVHDRLADVARQRAMARQRRTAEEERFRREKETAETLVLRQRAAMKDLAERRAEDAVGAARRVRMWMWALAGVAFVAVLLAGEAQRQRDEAVSQKEIAETARIAAEVARLATDQLSQATNRVVHAYELASRARTAAASGGESGQAEAAKLVTEASRTYSRASQDLTLLTTQRRQCPAGSRVYPHIGQGDDGAVLRDRIRLALDPSGFFVAPAQFMPPYILPPTTTVRFFRSEDRAGAEAAAAALQGAGLVDVSIQAITGDGTPDPCRYELWLARNPADR